jgi:hypothetical protein
MMSRYINQIFDTTLQRVILNQYKGYNPYDLLGSERLYRNIRHQKLRLFLTQLNKISPINFRSHIGIPIAYNPKALALIMLALINKDEAKYEKEIDFLFRTLLDLKSNAFDDYSIGFPFPIVLSFYTSEKNHPSLIISLFVIFAFIELYRKFGEQHVLDRVLSFENLLTQKLYHEETAQTLWYAYNFDQKNEIYNATAKIGKFLSELHALVPHPERLAKIKKILNYLVSHQRTDGSWSYGRKYQYSDSFHTAFILDAMFSMVQQVNGNQYIEALQKGFDNYKNYFFHNSGQPRYIHPLYKNKGLRKIFEVTRTDIRDCAMGIILFNKMNEPGFAKRICQWTIRHMRHNSAHYFYFYKEKYWPNRIEYIRPQGWMLFALSHVLASPAEQAKESSVLNNFSHTVSTLKKSADQEI